jgi:hypothetical protein
MVPHAIVTGEHEGDGKAPNASTGRGPSPSFPDGKN